MKRSSSPVPTFDAMLLPTVQALKMLGGSGTTEEIYDKVAQILDLPDHVLEIPHGSTSQGAVEYRLAWSRTYLKKYGLIENSARGVWSLVSTSINLDDLDAKNIVKSVKEKDKKKTTPKDEMPDDSESCASAETLEEIGWHQQLHALLLSLSPID
jgi:restriction system protein